MRPGAASANKGVRRFVEALRTWTAQLVCRCKEALAGLGGRLRFKAVKPAIPRLTKLPVQGELSLDRIRVVRNDLSDADLEVLAARPPTAPASPELALPTGKRAGVAAGRWAKVNARFFGAGRT